MRYLVIAIFFTSIFSCANIPEGCKVKDIKITNWNPSVSDEGIFTGHYKSTFFGKCTPEEVDRVASKAIYSWVLDIGFKMKDIKHYSGKILNQRVHAYRYF